MQKEQSNILLELSFLFFAIALNVGYEILINKFKTDNTYS